MRCGRVAKGLAEGLSPQGGATTGESVGDLLRAVRQEEAKVHVGLTSAFKVSHLCDLILAVSLLSRCALAGD